MTRPWHFDEGALTACRDALRAIQQHKEEAASIKAEAEANKSAAETQLRLVRESLQKVTREIIELRSQITAHTQAGSDPHNFEIQLAVKSQEETSLIEQQSTLESAIAASEQLVFDFANTTFSLQQQEGELNRNIKEIADFLDALRNTPGQLFAQLANRLRTLLTSFEGKYLHGAGLSCPTQEILLKFSTALDAIGTINTNTEGAGSAADDGKKISLIRYALICAAIDKAILSLLEKVSTPNDHYVYNSLVDLSEETHINVNEVFPEPFQLEHTLHKMSSFALYVTFQRDYPTLEINLTANFEEEQRQTYLTAIDNLSAAIQRRCDELSGDLSSAENAHAHHICDQAAAILKEIKIYNPLLKPAEVAFYRGLLETVTTIVKQPDNTAATEALAKFTKHKMLSGQSSWKLTAIGVAVAALGALQMGLAVCARLGYGSPRPAEEPTSWTEWLKLPAIAASAAGFFYAGRQTGVAASASALCKSTASPR